MSSQLDAGNAAAADGPLTFTGLVDRRRLVLYLCINAILLVVFVTQLVCGPVQFTTALLIVIIGLVVCLQFKVLRRPPQITVADGHFVLRLPLGLPQTWPVQEVIGLEHDFDTTRLTFQNVANVQPMSMRKSFEKRFALQGCHLVLIGPFAFEQIAHLRSVLGMDPLAEIRPGSLAEFRAETRAATPRAFVTPLLVAANLIAYAAMAICCRSHLQPTAQELVLWGADFGPLTDNGQAWRLFTAIFLHAGLMHLFVNMYVLANIGPLVERLFGNLGFAILYLIAGLWGSVASVMWHPEAVGVGASGAIFGLYGALGGFLLRHRQAVPLPVLRRYRVVTIGFVVFTLAFGVTDKQVDVAAHLGGLTTGFIVGLFLIQPSIRHLTAARFRRVLPVAIAGTASIALAVIMLAGRVVDATDEFQSFSAIDSSVENRIYDVRVRHQNGTASDEELIAVLETEGGKRWGAALDRLAGLNHVAESQRAYWSDLVRFATLRRDGWQLLAKGLRQHDGRMMEDADKMQSAADEIVNAMNERQKAK